jgi:hypothetical protein
MHSEDPGIKGRAFIIFEGVMPNPHPQQGADACLPLGLFWHKLSSLPAEERADALESFFFEGDVVDGFPAMIDPAHYGMSSGATGQIRTNFFVDDLEWNLREYSLRRQCGSPNASSPCALVVQQVRVKDNPAEELFSGTHPKANAFLLALPNIVESLAKATSDSEIHVSIPDEFTEWESVANRKDVNYRLVASAQTKGVISAKLTTLGSSITVEQLLDRATSQTCAGCHHTLAETPLGAGVNWSRQTKFVHVTESGLPSPLLTHSLLPARKLVLKDFINARCTQAASQP